MTLGDADLAAIAGHLGEALRCAGVGVTPERAGRFALAVHLTAPAALEELYWIGRVTLLSDHDQIQTWDRVFAQVFRGIADVAEFRGDTAGSTQARPPAAARPVPPRPPGTLGSPGSTSVPPASASPGREEGAAEGPETVMITASDDERLRRKDFAAMTPDELAWLREAMRDLALTAPMRRARRTVRAAHGDRLDLRRTLRRAQRTGGDPVRAARRRRRTRPRKVVMLCDVSGSMESYSRAYLQLLIGAVGGTRAEAFVFATRLTRVTRALRSANPDAGFERAGRAAPDWSGGTRIGPAIKEFNDRYGRPGMARGAVVVIISDGWERGDPAVLAEEMRRLRRLTYRLVWVNPRSSDDRFRPLTAGMAAALPYVDRFLSGHSLDAIDEVLSAIR